MSWLYILLAGLGEIVVVWGVRLVSEKKYLWGGLVYLSSFALSLWLLRLGMANVDMSVAYAAYTGIGVIGTVCSGIIFWHESRRPQKFIYIFIIMLCIFALKLSSR